VARYTNQKIVDLLAIAEDTSKRTRIRGAALETLAVYLFDKVPGVIIGPRNQFDAYRCQEIDVALFNRGASDGLAGFPNDIRVECKSWSSPVGSMEVAWFDSKLRSTGAACGILIALNGITGDRWQRNHANKVVEMAVGLPDPRHILVVAKQDIQKLRTSESFVELLIQRRMKVSTELALPFI
jgi:hypothetical protein